MKTVKHPILNTALFLAGLFLLATLVVLKFIEKQEVNAQKEKAILVLKTELVNNQYVLDMWKKWDDEIRAQLDTLIDKTGADENFKGRLPVRLLMNEKRSISANKSVFTFDESAWKALKSSGVAKHIAYETLYSLEGVYSSQRSLIDVYTEVPTIVIASKYHRNYSDADFRFLSKLQLTFSKIQLAEQQLGHHYDTVFRLKVFKAENDR